MASGAGTGRGSGAGTIPGASAARALEALVPPLRFALKAEGGAGRLAGFGLTARAAVARARALGVPDSRALQRLDAEAAAFDGLPLRERRRALTRIAAHLSALVPLPPELREVARSARIEMLSQQRAARGAQLPGRADAGPA